MFLKLKQTRYFDFWKKTRTTDKHTSSFLISESERSTADHSKTKAFTRIYEKLNGKKQIFVTQSIPIISRAIQKKINLWICMTGLNTSFAHM